MEEINGNEIEQLEESIQFSDAIDLNDQSPDSIDESYTIVGDTIKNEVFECSGVGGDTNSAPLEILAEFLTLIMKKEYEEAMQHCKTILEYEPNNETVLSFIPLLSEKLKLMKQETLDENNDKTESDSFDTDSTDNDDDDKTEEDISESSSDIEEPAINEGDTSNEISHYDSSAVSSLSSLASDDNEEIQDNDNISITSNHSSNSKSIESNNSTSNNSTSLNQSNSSNQEINNNSNKSFNSSNNSSTTNQSNSSKSDMYFSLENSSTTTSSSSGKLQKEIINKTLAKTIENIKRKYGIKTTFNNINKNINTFYSQDI